MNLNFFLWFQKHNMQKVVEKDGKGAFYGQDKALFIKHSPFHASQLSAG